MIPKRLCIKLKSAATFGRGDGLPGFIDREIEHDADGFPFLRGRTLKGLLAESAHNIVYALSQQNRDWSAARLALFGRPGRGVTERGILHLGNASIPAALRQQIMAERARCLQSGLPDLFTPQDVLYSLTGVRRQTAINPDGAPEFGSLRSMRVVLRGVVLESTLDFSRAPSDNELALLAAAVLDFRHAGTGRNRGRGWVLAELDDNTTTRELFNLFAKAVKS